MLVSGRIRIARLDFENVWVLAASKIFDIKTSLLQVTNSCSYAKLCEGVSVLGFSCEGESKSLYTQRFRPVMKIWSSLEYQDSKSSSQIGTCSLQHLRSPILIFWVDVCQVVGATSLDLNSRDFEGCRNPSEDFAVRKLIPYLSIKNIHSLVMVSWETNGQLQLYVRIDYACFNINIRQKGFW